MSIEIIEINEKFIGNEYGFSPLIGYLLGGICHKYLGYISLTALYWLTIIPVWPHALSLSIPTAIFEGAFGNIWKPLSWWVFGKSKQHRHKNPLMQDCTNWHRSLQSQERGHDFARPANLHFRMPIMLRFARTHGPIYEPTKLSSLKLPGRTIHSSFGRAFSDSPTGLLTFSTSFHWQQKQDLSFYMNRNNSPALFIALNCPSRRGQQLRYLNLCFA